MKALVVFYSRNGNTKKVAGKISRSLKADSEEIFDLKSRSGIWGWIFGGRDAYMKKSTEIKQEINPQKYDLVVIGTPIWAGTMTPAVRSYLKRHKLNKKVAFFCTAGDKQTSAFRQMEELSKKPITCLDLKQSKLNSKESDDKIKEFCEKLR